MISAERVALLNRDTAQINNTEAHFSASNIPNALIRQQYFLCDISLQFKGEVLLDDIRERTIFYAITCVLHNGNSADLGIRTAKMRPLDNPQSTFKT